MVRRVFYGDVHNVVDDLREIYRLEVNGSVLCRVSAEVPVYVPDVVVEGPWLHAWITRAIEAWKHRRAA
jgi:hypothetical protein